MKTAFLALSVVGSIALAGCSANTAPSPSPTPTQSERVTMTPAEAKASFKKITQASCNKAQSEGVVETRDGLTVVMTPKDQNYKDFSAAYFEEPSTYGLIWELDSITACADWYTFSMADEANQEAAIDVTYDSETQSYVTVEDFGDSGIFKYSYQVANGLLSKATNLDDPRALIEIDYGALSDAELEILTTAVDQHLAEG